ncbi:MAG: TonB-dependent receptor [Alphaproteobacteria bacterium]|nr:TonB-dependent receptor [Alphaproteobacteria bacterium]MBU1515288.1 TonB-dependent receptor [Alphaproteobacteria bacterium]MBU2092418.1 TonB-dependent receptor [Alphaproteobacteria bacterium]MBU2153012.1 TonB-dependent receptor [Alphaproteobacteria bacterium]MBU2305843.1 TonB-dependent receptor [Alphaproteobacteria bacterium]
MIASSKYVLLLGAAMAAMASAPALAQEGNEVETVVVTAQKRAENIQDVPMAVSAISGDQIEKRGVTNITELSKFLPSVQITQSNNNRNTTVFVRGVGTSGTNPGIEASVGLFLDGVYLPAAGPIQVNLQDISSLEVLRGPQGTLYGRNTPVGAINISTRAPQQAPEAMLTGTLGNYKDKRIAGYVGGGLTDNLSGRLSFWLADRDGYEHNLFTGDDVNGSTQKGLRGRLKWEPADDLDVNFIAYYANINSHCCTPDILNPTGPRGIATPGFLAASAAAGRPFRNFDDKDHVVDDDYESRNATDSYGLSVQVDKDLPGGHTLTSITAYNAYDDNITQLAADALPLDISRGFQRLLADIYSEEIRILSPVDQRLTYIGGVYLFHENMRYDTQSNVGSQSTRVFPGNARALPGEFGHFYYRQQTDSVAAFGQVTFNVTDVFRITGGGRYSWDKKDSYIAAVNSPVGTPQFRAAVPTNIVGDVSRSEKKFTWSLGAQYDITPDIMGYVLAATGYKTGGFNARAAAPNTPFEFDAENSMNYEVGLKTTLLDGALVFNIDVYRTTLKNFQDSLLNPLTGSGFIVGNAGERRSQGVEADARWRVTREFSLNGSMSYNDAEFTDYTAGQCYGGQVANGTKPGSCNYNGQRPAQNPKVQWSLAFDWRHDLAFKNLGLFVQGDATFTDNQYLTATLDPRSYQSSYTLYGLRAGVESQSGQWRLSAYGKNLSDKSYYLQTTPQPLSFLIGAGGTTAADGFVGWYGAPRTYGVELQVKF